MSIKFRTFAENNIVVFDGGMGTTIQKYDISDDVWNGKNGCNEYLNSSYPEIISEIHTKFLEAGADVVETNTFGATRLVLSEYGLEEMVYELNYKGASIAKAAALKFGKYAAGSIGPGTKLPSLSQISYDDLYLMYKEQAKALSDGDVDMFIVETCQDLIQIKAAVNACLTVQKEAEKDLPILVSVTVEQNGTMLTGSDLSTVSVVMGGYEIFSLGINCALGPEMMYEPLTALSDNWIGRTSCIPNAGLPKNIDGKFFYDLSPEDMGEILKNIVERFGVNIVGGCCGSTYEHIKAIKEKTSKIKPIIKVCKSGGGFASSLFTAQSLSQTPPPALIGERANSNGSKAFRELLLKDDFEGMLKIAKDQEEEGAHFIDLCTAYAGRNELSDMSRFISMTNNMLSSPAVIDSTEPPIIESCLKLFSGKPIINSINLEDGGKKLYQILDMVKQFPAAVIALTIDETGMAMNREKKVEIAKRIFKIWTEEYSFPPEDLIFDPLTFSIGSGDENLRYAALETLDAIKEIKENLIGVKTVLGLSNVSFGLTPASRVVLNSVFLNRAVEYGLDMAIVHASKVLPDSEINLDEKKLSEDLVFGKDNALMAFINHFADKKGGEEKKEDDNTPDEVKLKIKLKKGDKTELELIINRLLSRFSPYDIINNILMEGMQEVGVLFGQGKMLLPFVLQSAEVMKKSVSYLETFMEKNDSEPKGKIVLATVKGDVHDIGKNLVDIILSNNGYKVYNLGIKVPVEEMIEKAVEIGADAIGMSGLLVKSTLIMKENIEEIKRRNLHLKVLLGGAALTEGYVKNDCQPIIPSRIFYCRDAFSAITALASENISDQHIEIENKRPRVNQISSKETNSGNGITPNDLSESDTPTPPFYGRKLLDNINIDDVVYYINKFVLVSNRWGYKKTSDMKEDDYSDLINSVMENDFKRILADIKNIVELKVIYGYYRCRRDNNNLNIFDDNGNLIHVFKFPRQQKGKMLCIADYFKYKSYDEYDILPIQIVTVGEKVVKYIKEINDSHNFKEYFLTHGFLTELTEALAHYTHRIIREELGIDDKNQKIEAILNDKYRGLRYSFGYPSCPDLEENETLAAILKANEIGISLTETFQMVPEFTTSAIILHNRKAEYFTI